MVAADWAEGMGASLRAGLLAFADSTDGFVLVSLVDLPDLVPEVVARVGSAARSSARRWRGRRTTACPATRSCSAATTGPACWRSRTGDRGARDYLAGREVEPGRVRRPGHRPRTSTPADAEAVQPTANAARSSLGGHAGLQRGDLRRRCRRPARRDRLPLRRRAGHRHLPRAAHAAAAAARGRARHRQDRARRGIAEALDLPLVRLQCYEGIDATQALYDWDFPRQILHLRALEAAGGGADAEEAEKSLYDERFLLARPVLAALQQSPAVLLVDEVDRADDEFEAFLLEVLSTYQVTIPELGTVRAATPPVVVLTSNRTRELHDALKRRCLYHWIDHPGLEREVADRALPRAGGVRGAGRAGRHASSSSCATRGDLQKPPGVAETLDWARALHHLGTAELDLESAAAHARRPGEVPRGRRPGEAGPRPDADGREPRDPAGSADGSHVDAGRRRDPARLRPRAAGRAASRSPRTAPRGSSPRPPCSASTTSARPYRRRPGHALRRARRPRSATTRSSRRSSTPATGCPAHGPRSRAPSPASPSCRWTTATGEAAEAADEVDPRARPATAEVLRHRDVAEPRRRPRSPGSPRMFATLRPRPPPRRTAPAPALAPRRGRRLPHPARQPAPAWASRPRSSGAAAAQPAPAGGAAGRRVRLDERRTPTRCCGWPTGSPRAASSAAWSRRSRSAPGSPT